MCRRETPIDANWCNSYIAAEKRDDRKSGRKHHFCVRKNREISSVPKSVGELLYSTLNCLQSTVIDVGCGEKRIRSVALFFAQWPTGFTHKNELAVFRREMFLCSQHFFDRIFIWQIMEGSLARAHGLGPRRTGEPLFDPCKSRRPARSECGPSRTQLRGESCLLLAISGSNCSELRNI